MNEEEIIKKIEYFKINGEPSSSSSKLLVDLYDLYNREKEENRKKNIVISEYQDLLEREQEKNKKLEEGKEAFKRSYERAAEDEANMALDLAKAGKVIDMVISDYIIEYIGGEHSDTPCEYYHEKIKVKDECKDLHWDEHHKHFKDCVKCLKQYYINKVRGENDEQMQQKM